jgi:hypothetical protein
MKKIYFKLSLLMIIGGFAIMGISAALDFSLPFSNPESWTKRFDSQWHTGKDLYAYDFNKDGGDAGEPILATADGTVVFSGNTTTSGGIVTIKHDGFSSLYAHLSARRLSVKVGDFVKKGQVIGYVGGPGEGGAFTTGSHLHFAVYKQESGGRLVAYDLKGLSAFNNMRMYGSGGVFERVAGAIGDLFFGKDVGGSLPLKPIEKIDLTPISGMVEDFYRWAFGVAGVVAFGVLIYGGILYISSAGNASKQGDAKEWIKAAISGLFLLLTAYIILYTINPCIVSFGGSCS